PLTDSPQSVPQSSQEALDKADTPSYDLSFTCRRCSERSKHRITKQAYHHGSVLVTCPGCKNRHVITDHLKIFSEKGTTLEEIMKEKGEILRKARIGPDGDVEFWEE
ncbi:zf-DNL-domain-containing protein, partial [Piedraia hortae CBS 480.64]